MGVQHADHGVDGLLPDRQALLDEPRELLQEQPDLCHGRVTALGDDLVAAQRHTGARTLCNRLEQAIAVRAELLGEGVVDGERERRHTQMVPRGAVGAQTRSS